MCAARSASLNGFACLPMARAEECGVEAAEVCVTLAVLHCLCFQLLEFGQFVQRDGHEAEESAGRCCCPRAAKSRCLLRRTEQVEQQLLRVSHVASSLHASNAKHCSVSTLPAIHQHHHVVQFPALLVLCLWCGCCEWLPTVFSTACLSWSSTKSSSEYMHTTLCALLVVAAVVVLCCCPCSSISLIWMPSSWKHQQHSARASAPR